MTLRNYFLSLLFTSTVILTGCVSSTEPTVPSQPIEPLASLTETYWKLTKLDGKEVSMAANQQRERHFVLHSNDNRFSGFSGCNRFFGQYQYASDKAGNGSIGLSSLGATKMACPDVAINEQEFLSMFAEAVFYEIYEESLTLFNKDNAVLATFEAVYF